MLLIVHARWNTENRTCIEKKCLMTIDGANDDAVDNAVDDDNAVNKHCIAHLQYNVIGNCTCYTASGHGNGKAKAATEEKQMLTNNQLANQSTSATSNICNNQWLEAAPVNKNSQPMAGVVRLAATIYISASDEPARSAGWCNWMHIHHGDSSWTSLLWWWGGYSEFFYIHFYFSVLFNKINRIFVSEARCHHRNLKIHHPMLWYFDVEYYKSMYIPWPQSTATYGRMGWKHQHGTCIR